MAKIQEQFENKIIELIATGNYSKNETYVYSLTENGDIIINAYLGNSVDNFFIPEKIEGLTVLKVGSLITPPNTIFKTVTIPKSVEYICDSAFERLGIEKLIFEKNSKIKKIGKNAFRYNNLKEMNLPRKNINISFDAFSDNPIKIISVYKEWEFEKNNTLIGFSLSVCADQNENSIINSDKLEEVIFEEGCINIYPKSFAYCKNLKKITIPSTVKNFGAYAFQGCSSLSEIIINGKPKISVENSNSNINQQDVINAISQGNWDKVAISMQKAMMDPFSAIGIFNDCRIDLKTKSALLKMDFPKEAF